MLAVSGDESYAIYLYADGLIQWPESGNALAGYNSGNEYSSSGDGYDYGDELMISSYTIPGSLTEDILAIASTSNIGVAGVWVFQLDEHNPILPACNEDSFSK